MSAKAQQIRKQQLDARRAVSRKPAPAAAAARPEPKKPKGK